MKITLQLTGVDDEVERLERALDFEMDLWGQRAGELVAETAKHAHPYQDRSGDLTASISGGYVSGRFLAGTLESLVEADTTYAEYVDETDGFAFLEPAYDAVEHHLDADAQVALDLAAQRARW